MNAIYDVAVIGAGPAGAWTACLLSRSGARVALIDPSHPREKPCGGGVTGRALALVGDAVDVNLPAVGIRAARFLDSVSGRSASIALDGAGRQLVVASRKSFDGMVLDAARAAGAEWRHSRATAIGRDGGRWRIATADGGRLDARTLVGADGANSLVRRRVTRPFRREQLSIATGFYARGATSSDIVIEFTADPPGYMWSFPRPDHLAIGICAQADGGLTAAALRARVARWLELADVRCEALDQYAWPIPSLSAGDFETLDVAGPGWMLVGDAAGLVDPITREGIFFALHSAALAAGAIVANGPASTAATLDYRRRVTADIVAELARAARFKARFFRPRFIQLMLDGLARSEGIRRVMGDLIAGSQSYRGLKWRLAETLEFGLAWKALFPGSQRSQGSQGSQGSREPREPDVTGPSA